MAGAGRDGGSERLAWRFDRTIGARWLVVTTSLPPRGEGFLLVDALRRLGALAVEPNRESVIAIFPAPADVHEVVSDVEAAIRANTSSPEPSVRWSLEGPDAWLDLWSAELGPRRVSKRIRVRPSLDPETEPERLGPADEIPEIDILLTPGLAFGTAEHPTTRSCLRFLEALVAPGTRVADIGTGSGVLAIAAARLGAGFVLAVDSDPGACATATRNVDLNGVSDRVEIRESTLTPDAPPGAIPFRGVVANLEPDVLVPLLPTLLRWLDSDGWLLVSGVPTNETHRVHAVLERAPGITRTREEVEAGWWTAAFRRETP